MNIYMGSDQMKNVSKLEDMLHMEMATQALYNKYMLEIENPELRQMFTQMRDGKVQQITKLQQEIKSMKTNQGQ
jgi:ferritin-like metal-binding protein YciE